MAKPEFLLKLPMPLLAEPAHLDGPDKLLHRCVSGLVAQIVFARSARAMFADQPDFFARHYPCRLVRPRHRSIPNGGTDLARISGTCRYGLNAIAITKPNQPDRLSRKHPCTGFVMEGRQKRS